MPPHKSEDFLATDPREERSAECLKKNLNTCTFKSSVRSKRTQITSKAFQGRKKRFS